MITNYSIVSGEELSVRGAWVELIKEVRECMLHGWQPLGAPFYCGTETIRGTTCHVFCQALVKSNEGK